MSEFGLKIMNFASGAIEEVANGVRDRYDCKSAMLTNSLFKDYMVAHGLNIWKEESTRDIICIDFSYGSRSYEEEVKHLNKKIKELNNNSKLEDNERNKKIDYLNSLLEKAKNNKDRYVKQSKAQLRKKYYQNGVDIYYHTHNKNGKIIDTEVIHYKMLYRSTGKAKRGNCMFINEKIYDVARDYLYMGIKLPEKNAPIVEIGAYSSLVASTIVGKVKINPENILILKDVDSYFNTKVVSIETDEHKHCHAIERDNYKVKNTLFDGQALIDHSIFPNWGDGYILLRQHMFKAAAFDCYLQQWFKDYYGDEYENAVIKDMWGNEHKVKDILLVTTDNACKWLKFQGVTYEYWSQRIKHDNDNWFGIVKTAHQSKLGNVQYQSYQMVNALDINSMDGVLQCTKDYIYKLKHDPDIFLEYLKRNANYSNDYEVLIALVNQDRDFLYSKYFKERKDNIVKSYVRNAQMGRIINEGDNLTIIGSPFAMLLYTVGEDVNQDDTFSQEDGCIQCFTERFKDGEYLAEFRSPFNSRNNLGCVHNVYSNKLKRYFNIGRNCIAVNLIGTDWQDRNNGSDQDSDMVYTTNQPDIVKHAKYCVKNYPTIVNNIPKEKNRYDLSMKSFAKVDNMLGASQMLIGTSSNLAQCCLSYSYSFPDKKYEDYVCILSVLAQAAIDSAKRSFDIKLDEEVDRIKKDMNIPLNGYPVFWKPIKKRNDKRNGTKLSQLTDKQIERRNSKYNDKLICPMNYLYNTNINSIAPYTHSYRMDKFFISYPIDLNKWKSRKVEALIERYSLKLFNYNINNQIDNNENSDEYLLLRADFDNLIKDIRQISFSKNYLGLMSYLIDRAFSITKKTQDQEDQLEDKTNLNKNKSLLLKTLYELNPDQLLKCFQKNILSSKK